VILSEYPDRNTLSGYVDKRSYRIYRPDSSGDAVRHCRTEAGFTQAELAELTGLHRSYLSELETGRETEQLVRATRVLRRLGLRITIDKAEW
jgi:transcriptional regulator with XRE-family HTH domain